MRLSRTSTALHLVRRSGEALTERLGHAWTRLRDRSHATTETSWAHFRGTSVLAHRWVSARAAMDLTLADCTAALAGIPHEVLDGGWELPRVHVAPGDWAAAVNAIGAAGSPLYLAQVDEAGRPTPARPIRAWRSTDPSPEHDLRVYRAWADEAGRFVAGPDVGVVLTSRQEPVGTPPGDIDVVFTWVDGADPAWQARRRERDADGPLHATATNAARFIQVDELRYALRAVERFAPWRRYVFLVTDGQRPSWLEAEFPHVKLVDHREIFNAPGALPTFNSHAIESRLHHIQGLAEHWVYLNDDVFLARYTPPSDYFTPDRCLLAFLTDEPLPEAGPRAAEPVAAAAHNNSTVLQHLTGQQVRHKLKHVPHPQLRSATAELERLAPAEFLSTQLAPFRSPTDLSVASSLAPHYAVATGRGRLGDVRHFYADVASPELRWRLPRLLEWRDADVICLNATTTSPVSQVVRLAEQLERFFGSLVLSPEMGSHRRPDVT